MIIGITGGSGCGKTTLLRLLREQGAMILDCDEIYRELLERDPALVHTIEKRFPGTVQEGILDRKKLGALVFGDEQALLELNAITHGAVKAEVCRRLTPEPKLAAIDAIALFEGGLAELCKLTVAVTAPYEARLQRLMARDGISREYGQARIAAQPDNGEFVRRCDCFLENNGNEQEFQDKCLAFFRQLDIMK